MTFRKAAFAASVVIAAMAISLGCGGDKGTGDSGQAEWTILSYGAGNNDLDYSQAGNSYCIQDIQEMQKVGSSDKVHVVAMLASLKTGGNAKYYHVEKHPNDLGDNISSEVLEDLGAKDMSSAQILREFLVYGIEHYPAKRYMVIIDDHGAGWPGSCVDEQNGSGNLMTMVDMANAFRGAINETDIGKFDLITFHCCLMSQVEVVYELRDCADYMVASEFAMPMESVLGSVEWLGDLVAAPTTSPKDLAKKIVTAVYNAGVDKQKYVHMAATDLVQADRLAARVDDLGTQLSTTATVYWNEVYDAWSSTWNTDLDHPAYVDIRNFANNIKQQPNLKNINLVRNAADSIIAVMNDIITMTKTNVAGITRGGLTIHMPYVLSMYDSTNYARLDFQDVGWTNFLSIYIRGLEQTQTLSLTVNISPAGGGTVTINPDQEGYQSGDVVVLEAIPASGYTFNHWELGGESYTYNPVQLTFGQQDVVITAHFTGGGGSQSATITGTITWPGHSLSGHTYVFADSLYNSSLYLVEQTTVNPSTGSFTLVIENLTQQVWLAFEAQDDVNANSPWQPDAGDAWGFYDANVDAQWNDLIGVSPGQTLTGVNITMSTVSGISPGKKFFQQEK